MLKKFKDLTEREILALAIQNEEEDGRIYGEFADALREGYPATADMFEEMRVEEVGHRDRLFEEFRGRFGEQIPPIRREDVKGFLQRRPLWLVRPLGGRYRSASERTQTQDPGNSLGCGLRSYLERKQLPCGDCT